MKKKTVSIVIMAVILVSIIIVSGITLWVKYGPDANKDVTKNVEKIDAEIADKAIIKDVKNANLNGFTVTTGIVKNNDTKKHNILVQVNFYDEKNKVIGEANTLVSIIASGESRSFSTTVIGDFTKNKYKIEGKILD